MEQVIKLQNDDLKPLLESINDSIQRNNQILQEILNQQKPPEMMSQKEAAKYLGLHYSTVQRLAENKELPFYKSGKKKLFSRNHLDIYLQVREIKE